MACLRDYHQSRWPHRQLNSMILRGWNNSFHTLCGDHDPSIWTVIEALRQDEVLATSATLQDKIGERRRKQCRRAQKTFEEHLLNLCSDCHKDYGGVPAGCWFMHSIRINCFLLCIIKITDTGHFFLYVTWVLSTFYIMGWAFVRWAFVHCKGICLFTGFDYVWKTVACQWGGAYNCGDKVSSPGFYLAH